MQTQKSLAEIRADVKCLVDERAGKGPTRFEIMKVRKTGKKFARSRAFIEELEMIVPEFYDEVGQHLRPWLKPPPAMEHAESVPEENAEQAELQEVEGVGSDLDREEV